MKMIIKLAMVLLSFFLAGAVYPQRSWRSDPFDPMFPKIEMLEEQLPQIESPELEIGPLPDLTIEGIIWGVDVPHAIINGEVYKEGDSIEGEDIKINKIERGKVLVDYSGKTYINRIKKRETQ